MALEIQKRGQYKMLRKCFFKIVLALLKKFKQFIFSLYGILIIRVQMFINAHNFQENGIV